jgi:hypothetical protein
VHRKFAADRSWEFLANMSPRPGDAITASACATTSAVDHLRVRGNFVWAESTSVVEPTSATPNPVEAVAKVAHPACISGKRRSGLADGGHAKETRRGPHAFLTADRAFIGFDPRGNGHVVSACRGVR